MDRKETEMKRGRKNQHKILWKMQLKKFSAWKYHEQGKGKNELNEEIRKEEFKLSVRI